MKRFALFMLAVMAVAGEVYCLTEAYSVQERKRAVELSAELRDTVLEISASLRSGEVEKYQEARGSYDEELQRFSKYAGGSNLFDALENYQAWLETAETEKLLYFNSKINEFNIAKSQMTDISERIELAKTILPELNYSKNTSDDFAELINLAERTRDCDSYCFAEDYEALQNDYQALRTKISDDWSKINNEYAARLQTEAIIKSLEEF